MRFLGKLLSLADLAFYLAGALYLAVQYAPSDVTCEPLESNQYSFKFMIGFQKDFAHLKTDDPHFR